MSFLQNLTLLCFLILASFFTDQAIAENGCSTAPKSKFQDRAKIDDILKPKGLMINKINDDHGCYKVVAVTKDYRKIILFFNAETLKQVELESKDTEDEDLNNSDASGD